MKAEHRYVALNLVAGAIALASYLYLMLVTPSARFYLGNVGALPICAWPYLTGAALAWQAPGGKAPAPRGVRVASWWLIVFAIGSSAWRIAYANSWGGDMQGAFVILEALFATASLIGVYALFAILRA